MIAYWLRKWTRSFPLGINGSRVEMGLEDGLSLGVSERIISRLALTALAEVVYLFELNPKCRSDRCRHNVLRIENENRGCKYKLNGGI